MSDACGLSCLVNLWSLCIILPRARYAACLLKKVFWVEYFVHLMRDQHGLQEALLVLEVVALEEWQPREAAGEQLHRKGPVTLGKQAQV